MTAALARKSARRQVRHVRGAGGDRSPAGFGQTVRDDSYEGWYKRIENNGWRPVSQRVLVDVDEVNHSATPH